MPEAQPVITTTLPDRSVAWRQSDAMLSLMSTAALEVLIVRPRAALGCGPGDDIVWILDVAGLAVHAIGGIDAQHLAAIGVIDDLIDPRRTEALTRIAKLARTARDAD